MNLKVLACLLPTVLAVLALLEPTAPGAIVSKQEAQNVVGAVCWVALSTTHNVCDPNDSHSLCWFSTSWGSTPVFDLQSTNQLASGLVPISCPCSSGLSSQKSGGTCVGGG